MRFNVVAPVTPVKISTLLFEWAPIATYRLDKLHGAESKFWVGPTEALKLEKIFIAQQGWLSDLYFFLRVRIISIYIYSLGLTLLHVWYRLRDVAKLKKNPNSQKKIGSWWVGPGPFWIENQKLKNPPKIIISDEY